MGGAAPTAYVSQPLWAYGGYAENAYKCPSLNMYSPADGTPIICTSHVPSLFYRNRDIKQSDPGADLASKIRVASQEYSPPFFITVYGGLKWTAAKPNPLEEFWFMLNRTMEVLGPGYVAVGASEMARLATVACGNHSFPGPGPTPPPPPPTCANTKAQADCSPIPGKPWKNSTEAVCTQQLGCCWHPPGTLKPSGHTCIKPEAPEENPTCVKPRQANAAGVLS